MSDPTTSHLLIVDDDERIRELLKRYLVKQGFIVTSARDAAQARRLLAGLAFDLIVLDVMMPGEDGIDLTRWLRTQSVRGRRRRLPAQTLRAARTGVANQRHPAPRPTRRGAVDGPQRAGPGGAAL